MQRCRPPLDLQTAGQDAFVAATGGDAVLHHLPDPQQAAAGFAFRAPGRFIGQHDLADRQVLRGPMAEQLFCRFEREGQYRAVFDDTVGTRGIFIDDKAAAHRVVLAAADLQTRAVEGAEDHAIGVIGQGFANHRQVFFLVERNAVFAEQVQAAVAANLLQARGDGLCIHGVRVFAFQAEQHSLVTAVAFAGGAKRAVEFGLDADRGAEQLVAAQALGKTRGGAHGADGMGTGGADADLEQVEDA
ncbi:hypothetical protein D9M73_165600 [compost metagenome]